MKEFKRFKRRAVISHTIQVKNQICMAIQYYTYLSSNLDVFVQAFVYNANDTFRFHGQTQICVHFRSFAVVLENEIATT